MRQGTLVDPSNGAMVDEAMGVLMEAPRSYTCEDVFEIHCHGNPLILEQVVSFCLRLGCRPAKPGEFTLRAFLHGRLDLTQAEAVLDVVRAASNAGLELAVRQLSGWLAERVEPARNDLVGVLAGMEALVDFVENDIPPQIDRTTHVCLEQTLAGVQELLAGTEHGIILRDGASLAIVGSPNVGKSSIMNALLGLDRSIVTAVAGTTRDTVGETVQIRGIPFRIIDTAGITSTSDPVELIGIERSRQALMSADVGLLVVDRARPWSMQDELTVQAVEAAAGDSEGRRPRLVLALNKADLPTCLDPGALIERLRPAHVVESSAVEPGGVDMLRHALERAALGGAHHEWMPGNVRHRFCLRQAASALEAALRGLGEGVPLDLVSFDVRAAARALGEITGANVDDELLDRIFRDFCIGK